MPVRDSYYAFARIADEDPVKYRNVSLCFQLGTIGTEQNCQEHNDGLDNILGVNVDVEQRHSVSNHAHKNDTHERTGDFSGASIETGPANHDGCRTPRSRVTNRTLSANQLSVSCQ